MLNPSYLTRRRNNHFSTEPIIDLTGNDSATNSRPVSIMDVPDSTVLIPHIKDNIVLLDYDEAQDSTRARSSVNRLKRRQSDKHVYDSQDETATPSPKKMKQDQNYESRSRVPSTRVDEVADNFQTITLLDDTGSNISRRSSIVSTSSNDLDDDTDFESFIESFDAAEDDDVQFLGERKCPKPRMKKKAQQILDSSKTYENGGRLRNGTIKNIMVHEGSFIEFLDGTFMQVCAIYPHSHHLYILIGPVFTRVTEEEVLMPKRRDALVGWRPAGKKAAKLPRYTYGADLLNEVYQRIRIQLGEAKHDEGLWRRSALDFKCLRILCTTNLPYETLCTSTEHIRNSQPSGRTETTIVERVQSAFPLRCRWKEVVVHDEYGKHKEHRFERPSREDIDKDVYIADNDLQREWRGPTINLGLPSARAPDMVDGFCGAGGMTSAAEQAGIEVKESFDRDSKKIATHRANFPQCRSLRMSVQRWINQTKERSLKVDILHLSPPCQPFSAANTTPNEERNESNQIPLLACSDVVRALRPRIVTIEETPGITGRHVEWFGALINQFTELGFQVRWAILACSDFGVPQLRKRLFIVAAAPGEDLPELPKPTHCPGEVSIQKTLAGLEAIHRVTPLVHHDPKTGTGRAPYDANRLANTITCKGGENYHPDGTRQFTVREFLALQTFPNNFKFPLDKTRKPFPQAEMKTQLGNAVPPLFGKAILESVVKSLRARDQRELTRLGGSSEANAISI